MGEPLAGEHLVADCRAAGGVGAQVRERLALAQAEVRERPHRPAGQGALRSRRLEGSPDPSCDAISTPMRYNSGRLWTAAPEGWRLIQSAGIEQRESDLRIP